MNIQQRIVAFAELGRFLNEASECFEDDKYDGSSSRKTFMKICCEIQQYNPWFIERHVKYAIKSIAAMLNGKKLEKWIYPYRDRINDNNKNREVVSVMAGNIPLVGFHDFLCILLTGNLFIGKLSSHDNILLPSLAEVLKEIEPQFSENIHFTEEVVSDFDAIIATGSNNTSRYFEYYFGSYPNIIRKNRNGVAVLTGQESQPILTELGKDIFLYFGLGCRNVSKLFIPKNYSLEKLFSSLDNYSYVIDNHKYRNNYDYFKSVFLVNREEFKDTGFALFKKEEQISSPVSVIYFEEYNSTKEVNQKLQLEKENIQCVISQSGEIEGSIFPGKSQTPELWDYADNINPIEFLLQL